MSRRSSATSQGVNGTGEKTTEQAAGGSGETRVFSRALIENNESVSPSGTNNSVSHRSSPPGTVAGMTSANLPLILVIGSAADRELFQPSVHRRLWPQPVPTPRRLNTRRQWVSGRQFVTQAPY